MRPRLLVGLVLCALIAGAGCQPAKAGRRCRTLDWGDDGTHVLRCEKGRWRRVMTRGQAILILKAIAASRTTTTTTTTTTSVPALPDPLAAAQVFAGVGGAAPDAPVVVTSVSRDGRYVAAESAATNLVAGDTNGETDSFVRDTVSGVTHLISVNHDGSGPGDGDSGSTLVSDDGQFAYFVSYSTDILDPGTEIDDVHTYRRDLAAGTTEEIGLMPGPVVPNAPVLPLSISANGNFVAVLSGATNLVVGDTNGQPDFFVYDVGAGTYARASVSSDGDQVDELFAGVDPVIEARLSANGEKLFFGSTASTLVVGDTNGVADVFVRDLVGETTERVSVADGGGQLAAASYGISVSDDGTRVAFSTSGSPVGAFVRDLSSGRTLPGATAIGSPDGRSTLAEIEDAVLSHDGAFVLGRGRWTNDPGGDDGDVRHSLAGGTTSYVNRISPVCSGRRFVTTPGTAANTVTCADGRRWTLP